MKKEKGQVALVLVLVVGLSLVVGLLSLVSLPVTEVQVEAISVEAEAAKMAAWSGVDELMYRLRSRQEFGSSPFSVNLTLSNGATVSAEIVGDSSQKTVTARGYMGGVVKNLEVKVASASGKASFLFAVQSGLGGFELENNTTIIGKNGESGNVYSNGDILGQSKSSGQSGSKIMGKAWAVGKIAEIGTNGGVYIKEDAWADDLQDCTIGGNAAAPIPPTDCSFGGSFTLTGDGPSLVELAAVDAAYWKDQAANGGVYVGSCEVGGGGSDCTNGTRRLGNIKIEGDLVVPSNGTLTFTGPVWVDGDIEVSQNNQFFNDESLGTDSVVVVASSLSDPANKGRITTQSNVTFNLNSFGGGIIMISENTNKSCEVAPAIDITSNTATVVFVALDGCINVGANSFLAGVLGYKVHVSSNSMIEYDPSLAQAILGEDLGGWEVVSVREF